MSLIGRKAEAAEHMTMPDEPTAEIHAISAKAGAGANPSQPWAAGLVISISSEALPKTISRRAEEEGVTSVSGFP